MEHLNQSLFLMINHFAGSNAILDQLMEVLAKYLPILFALVLLWLGFFNKVSPSLQKKRRHAAFLSGYTMLIGISINFLIALFYFHPRPFMNHLGTELIPHLPDTSMPSDHTTLMVSVALGLFSYTETRHIGQVLLVLGIIGGLARVFCGVHYPFDIVGSIVVSCIAFILTWLLKDYLKQLNLIVFRALENKIEFLRLFTHEK
ncbi:undecaprenyl-diphosphatase [Marinomonas spartinae]|uniref:undecaprenyl-diphosphatase n=1 Tax=Marinomonas spartinae TaxID=1792290 RepID=UPI0018F19A58|nr:undecaprenyl-diphosphatase [Marinomonas spartinae]MBJ7556001.1 undecaprenyl-diphosphatase [Marinomonas spartinae]